MRVICANCGKVFDKRPSQIKKSRNDFCGSSCSAKYNNVMYPKRKLEGKCVYCGSLIPKVLKTCPSCRSSYICVACGERDEHNFYRTKKHMCKKCFNKKYHSTSKFLKKKNKAIIYLGGKCMKCGYNKYYGALELHHRDPSKKEYVWNKLRLRGWENIKKELDKCTLLCSNCHKELHANII